MQVYIWYSDRNALIWSITRVFGISRVNQITLVGSSDNSCGILLCIYQLIKIIPASCRTRAEHFYRQCTSYFFEMASTRIIAHIHSGSADAAALGYKEYCKQDDENFYAHIILNWGIIQCPQFTKLGYYSYAHILVMRTVSKMMNI